MRSPMNQRKQVTSCRAAYDINAYNFFIIVKGHGAKQMTAILFKQDEKCA